MKDSIPQTPLAQAILKAYAASQADELLEPHVLVDDKGKPEGRIEKGDSVIFYNIRGEREVELTQALTSRDFAHFSKKSLDLGFVTMIRYRKDLDVRVAFPPQEGLANTLGDVLARHEKKVVKITEAEKAVHLAYFLNGKREAPYPGEVTIVVPTRKDVTTFDQAPRMSAVKVTEETCKTLSDPSADVIIVNLCNVDVVGHFENPDAVIEAIQTVDGALGRIVACARTNEVVSVVTADHGTVERWRYPEGTIDTGHTSSPVPLVIDGINGTEMTEEGTLTDVAPTLLDLLGIEKPAEMTGDSLIKGQVKPKKRIMLVILDGWGHNDDEYGNMIRLSKTPNFDELWSTRPHVLLAAAGEAVGLPRGGVGNSEVGHLHIGAGRKILSDRVRINEAIEDGSFNRNQAFLWAVEEARRRKKALHLMGIVSFYSSHGSVKHLEALLELCTEKKVDPVYVHAMLGRRGERPQAGARYVGGLEEKCRDLGIGKVVGVIGRYWSMDREENWDRIEKTYRWLVEGVGIEVRTNSC